MTTQACHAGERPFDAVLSDVDGTLLGPTHALSPRTIRAVRACVEGGVPFAIATGRMPSGLERIRSELGVPVACVYYSGAYVVDADGSEVVSETIALPVAARALELISELWPQTTPCYFVGPHWYVADPGNPLVENEAAIVNARPEQADPHALLEAGVVPNKLFCRCPDPARSEEMRRTLAARLPELTVIRSRSGKFVELVRADVSKATGARALLGHWGVSMSRALFFGDDANDVPLLAAAGHGVAMANADRDIRHMADDVTLSNADDGVADYLERRLLPYL